MNLYNYECKQHGVFEAFAKTEERHFHLCECGEQCPMRISAPTVALDPISGDFPGATSSWEKKREQKMAVERKQDKCHIE